LDNKTPEQAFWELRSEVLAPLLVIEGISKYLQEDMIAKDINTAKIIKEINAIENSAEKIRQILDDIAFSLRK